MTLRKAALKRLYSFMEVGIISTRPHVPAYIAFSENSIAKLLFTTVYDPVVWPRKVRKSKTKQME